MQKIQVSVHDVNKRLDQFMTETLFEYSRSEIQSWIKEGNILVNEDKSKNNYRLKENDEILYEIIEKDKTIHPIEMDLDIIFEDEHLLIVNKPKGLIVHPSETTVNRETLVHGLLAYTDKLSDLGGEFRPGIVHRLDKDTSGLLMVAKTNQAHEILSEALKKREITREYLALVHHAFEHKEAIIDAPIGRDPNQRQRMAVTHINGKDAKTYVSLEEVIGDYSLLKCRLDSGRTHQIRVHLEYIKHPVVGDRTYSYKNTHETAGQSLHAYHLAFEHPITKQALSFTQDVPEIFKETLEMLRRLK